MKLDLYKIDGTTASKKVELDDEIFGIEPNDHAIYLAVKSYLANQRQGTHKAKERSEVRGGGKKPNVEAELVPVQQDLLCGLVAVLFSDRAREIIVRIYLRKLKILLGNQH
jgi:hypothetical protein